jgi:hypothetical protein
MKNQWLLEARETNVGQEINKCPIAFLPIDVREHNAFKLEFAPRLALETQVVIDATFGRFGVSFNLKRTNEYRLEL